MTRSLQGPARRSFSGPGRFTVFDNGFGYAHCAIVHADWVCSRRQYKTAKAALEAPMRVSIGMFISRKYAEVGKRIYPYWVPGKQENEGTKLAVEIVDSYGHDQTQAWYTDSMFTYRFFYNHLPFHLTQPKITKKNQPPSGVFLLQKQIQVLPLE